jgi:hypothetical protein
VAFAGLHAYWAAGGGAGLAGAAGRQLARQRPLWFVTAGLWGAAGLLLIGAVLAVGLTAAGKQSMRRRRVLAVGGWLAVLLLAVRTVPTLAQDVLTEAGLLSPSRSVLADWSLIHWRLALWTPWFALGAVMFTLALRNQNRAAVPDDRDESARSRTDDPSGLAAGRAAGRRAGPARRPGGARFAARGRPPHGRRGLG